MRDFSFVKTDQPTMAEFNKRFGDIAYVINNLGSEYVWHKTKTLGKIVFGGQERFSAGSNNQDYGIYYSDNYVIDESTGAISLAEPITIKSISQCYAANQITVNKYIKCSGFNDNKVCLCTDIYWASYGAGSVGYLPMSYVETTTSYGYVNSPDSNAYPIDDGYTYTALGQLGAKVQIATGSYIGTGTSGNSSANSLTFDFVPKLVVIRGSMYLAILPCPNLNESFVTAEVGYVMSNYLSVPIALCLKADGNTIYWYAEGNSASENQMNVSGVTYKYVAIG